MVTSVRRRSGRRATPLRRARGDDRDRGGGRCARACRARHDREGALHVGIDRRAERRDQHPAHAVREPGAAADGAWRSSPTIRRCCATGCRGTTRSAATTTSASSLYNGGTLYIDAGAPTPGGVRSDDRQPARDRHDRVLQRAARLRTAAAGAARRRGLPPAVLQPAADAVLRRRRPAPGGRGRAAATSPSRRCGERVPWVTGLGATETAPFALCTGRAGCRRPDASACRRQASS